MTKVVSTSTLSAHNDQELIRLFQDGNDQAIAVLIHRYKQRIFTTIKMLVKDHYLAEDIFQDTFIKIVQTLRKNFYADQGKFLPWALRIAHNLCIDHFRRTKQHVKIVTEDGEDITDLFVYTTDNAEKRMILQQQQRTIYQLLDTLPIEQREVVVMRIYADLSFKEIAQLTNVSINTALGRMRYGLMNLKKTIDEKQLVLR